MKMIKLEKQNEPRFDELSQMLSGLKDFLAEEADFNDKDWSENLNAIIDFQDEDGSFKLFDSFNIPSDARVDFCYMPTYLATATLMKAYLTDPESFTIKEISALSSGLKMSTARNLRGHGYEGLKGQIEALNIFMKAGLPDSRIWKPPASSQDPGAKAMRMTSKPSTSTFAKGKSLSTEP